MDIPELPFHKHNGVDSPQVDYNDLNGTPGYLILRNIPNSDPGIAGAVYTDENGVLYISAGAE